jgi:hypothetical protein
MNEFLQNIAAPSWWVSVVVVSFLINLASAYAKPLIDRTLAGLSAHRRRRFEQSKRALTQQLQAVEAMADGLVLLELEELKLALAAGLCISLSILVLLVVSLSPTIAPQLGDTAPLLLLIPLLLIVALFCLRVAMSKAALLRLAKERRHQAGGLTAQEEP